MIFLAELNCLEFWGADIGNSHLQAFTKEKVCAVAEPEFGHVQGHILIANKYLYVLRNSGLRLHERLDDCLRGIGCDP